MGKSGFLDDIDLQIIRGDEGKSRSKKSKQKLFTCADCGLNMQCQTPQFPAWGEGRKKILLVLDNPSIKEDELETPFSGPRGLLVKELLKEKLGLSIKKDCWVSYGVRCCSRKPIKSFNVDACRKYLHQDIEELKPKVIIPFGYWAMIAISGDILTSKSRGKTTDEWTGYTIPDQRFLTWIVPTWDIYQLNMETNKPDTVKLTQTLSHFENALRLLDVPVDKIDYEKRVIP
jgi:uracil-DNA glycosylase family 4